MVRVKDIIAVMEEIAPSHLAEPWDQTGLAVGNPEQEVTKILFALDVTKEVINEAIAQKADMILTHHPMLLFQKITSITPNTHIGNNIFRLIQNNITAFSAHTNLDIAEGGTNDVLANLISLQNVSLLSQTNAEALYKVVVYVPQSHVEVVRSAMCEAGAGHIGAYAHCTFSTQGEGTFLPLSGTNPYIGQQNVLERVSETRLETIVPESLLQTVCTAMIQSHPYEEVAYDTYAVTQTGKKQGIGRIGDLQEPMTFLEFAKILKQKLGLDHIRLTGEQNKIIKRVALCTGSGAEFLTLAHTMGADVYLTGDIKFHEAQKAVQRGLCVVDMTHYASEVLVLPILQQKLKQVCIKQNWNIELILSTVNGQTFWSL